MLTKVVQLLFLGGVWSQSLKYLLKDDVDHIQSYGENHDCYRTCGVGPARTCQYHFEVVPYSAMNNLCGECPYKMEDCKAAGCITAGGVPRLVTAANRQVPGPSILVCENDTVEVTLTNQLKIEGITIHWHGVHQVGTVDMDGAPYVTQDPVPPFGSFTYRFLASPHGTHMYHGHSGFQESDGLYGQLVIRRKEPESIERLYDYDLPEHTFTIWHWYNKSAGDELQMRLHRNESVFGFGLLVNGKGPLQSYAAKDGSNTTFQTERATFNIQKDKRYRFRMIFNSAIYCPIEFSIDNHTLVVFASDASYFEPVKVDSLMATSGERYDFVVTGDQADGCYWMRMRAFGDCGENKSSVHQEAGLCYGGAHTLEGHPTYQQGRRYGKLLNPIQEGSVDFSSNALVHLSELNSTEPEYYNYTGEADVTVFIELHSKPYNNLIYPGPWHQFNGVSFEFPKRSLLREMSPLICHNPVQEGFCIKDFCSCTYSVQFELGQLVELVFVDISEGRNQDHPVHLHGYQFHVMSTGLLGNNASVELVRRTDQKGLLYRKPERAVAKDSITVPNMGYTVVRFKADNPGYWMLHCHVTNHMELGMAMVVQVGTRRQILDTIRSHQSSASLARPFAILVFAMLFLGT